MSVRLEPCHGCPLRAGCEQREQFRKRVAGLGLRSARFRCEKLAKEMRPGRRIVTLHPVEENHSHASDYEPDIRMVQHEALATIYTTRNDRFSCIIDAGQFELAEDRFRFRKARRHTRIVRFLDEPDRPLCHQDHIMVDGKCDTLDGECKVGPKSGPNLDPNPNPLIGFKEMMA